MGGEAKGAETESVKEVYAAGLTLNNGDAKPPFAYVVEAPREFARSRKMWGMSSQAYGDRSRSMGFDRC